MTMDLETGIPERLLYPRAFQFWAPSRLIFLGGTVDALIPLPKIFGVRLLIFVVLLLVSGMCVSFGLRSIMGAVAGAVLFNFAVLKPFELGYIGTTTLTDESG